MKSYTKSYAFINYTVKGHSVRKTLFGLLLSSCLFFFFQNCTNIFSNFRPQKGNSLASMGTGLCSFDRFYLNQEIDLEGSTCLSSNSNTKTKTKLYFSPGDLVLKSGQIIGDDHLFLSMQNDGNLILYVNYQAVWNSNTWGQCPGGCTAIYQEDGNFVIYSTTKAVFATGWNGSGGLGISDVPPYFLPRPKDFNPSSLQSFGQNNEKIASVGFNEEFILGYGLSMGYVCPLWGGTSISHCNNYIPMPLSRIQSYLDALVRMNIKVHREIVPVKYFSDPANLKYIVTVFREFQKRDMTLIFVPGNPIQGPQFMNGLLGISTNDQAMNQTFTDLANYTADLFIGLRKSGKIDANWLNRNVIIEPFSEFDSLPGIKSGNIVDMTSYIYGSPLRGKILHDKMETAFRSASFDNEITAPSIVNVYHGSLSAQVLTKYDALGFWLKDYYAAGGRGRPSVHVYYGYGMGAKNQSAAALKNDLMSGIETVIKNIPTQYRQNIIVGEIGFPEEVSAVCDDGITAENRETLYKSLIQDATLNKYVDVVLFWRLAKLNARASDGDFLGCSSQFGIMSVEKFNSSPDYWSTFEGTPLKIFETLFFRWRQH
ncbi:MAG: hypothetical protein IPK68_01375 [Bdellovibrionales bacterium]|nr:hypothetical protein [Bdellovibrionales bacterium]